MKSLPTLCVLLLTLALGTAGASGVNVRWTNCLGDGGTDNRDFACTSNSGSNVLIGSFVLDSDLFQVNGNELVVDLVFDSAGLPEWWQFRNVGACRLTALSIAAHEGTNCPDMFQGQASMNIAAYQLGRLGPNTARILCVNAVQPIAMVELYGGQEYAIAKWTITNTKTVGTGSCAGRLTPACIVFNSANITTEGNVNNTRLMTGSASGSYFVTWQAHLVPTRRATWSSVKSLYSAAGLRGHLRRGSRPEAASSILGCGYVINALP